MKSTRKTIYNHRIAQSKEKWETDFLSKIEKPNDLLYLAAVKSNNYTKTDDSYYTEGNKAKIISTLNEIVANSYNERWHENFANMKNAALEILDKKIIEQSSKNPSTSDSTNTSDTPSSSSDATPELAKDQNNSPFGQSAIGQFPKTQSPTFDPVEDNFTEEAKTILDQLDDIDKIANQESDKFKRQWLELEKKINSQINIATNQNRINIKESSDIKARIENLNNKWASLFYPGGLSRSANGTIFPLDVRDAKASLLEQILTNKDSEQVTKLRDIFQKAFLDKRSTRDEELSRFLKELNIAISRRNGRQDIEGYVKPLIMSQFR